MHHLGRARDSLAQAWANIEAWTHELEGAGLDAIVVNASGCGAMVKDYGVLFRHDSIYAGKAAKISALARDISELLAELELPAGDAPAPLKVAYHSACSLQHGQIGGGTRIPIVHTIELLDWALGGPRPPELG